MRSRANAALVVQQEYFFSRSTKMYQVRSVLRLLQADKVGKVG